MMELVFTSALRAIDDLRAPGMIKLFLLCVGITTLIALTVVVGGVSAVQGWFGTLTPQGEDYGPGWISGLLDVFFWAISLAAFLVPAFLIFWSLMIFVASFFDEHIARKIEEFRYPEMAVGQDQPFWPELRQDILFVLKTILLNLILIIIPLFWPFWPILFPLLNAYLLGTYFFMMAGGRHVGKKQAKQLARQNRFPVIIAGLLIVVASGIPILNLAVPFWGVAMMVHLYHLTDNPPVVETLPPA